MSLALVTGASGFVGRRLVAQLRRDCEVRTLGRTRVEGGEHVHWDAAASAVPAEALVGVSRVFHFAAYLPGDYSDPEEAQLCLDVNALGSLRLLEACAAAKVAHVVSVSSGNLYRNTGESADENAPLFPAAAPYYMASKLAQEVYTAEYARHRAAMTLRPSAVFGPGMKDAGLVPTFAKRLLAGEPIEVHDGGRYGVDLVFVDDVVRLAIRGSEEGLVGPLNAGSGRRTTIRELAEAMRDLVGAAVESVHLHPEGDGAPGGFAPLDMSRARQTLGHEPTSLRDGVGEYLKWRAA